MTLNAPVPRTLNPSTNCMALQTFLYLMTLRTGTELSTLSLLLNKVSGLYGLLAILTGIHLSPLQLSMYIYSIIALALVTYLAPHIRHQSPLECLTLAVFFVVDTIVNAAYTAAFGITWFLVVSQHHTSGEGGMVNGPGSKMMDSAAGFTSPEHKNVSSVDVVVGPDQGIPGGAQDAVTAGNPSGGPDMSSAPGNPSLGHGVLQPESISSIVVICALWAIRVYFVLVVMNYARLVLRRHVAATSRNRVELWSGSKDAGMLEDPFGVHLPEGKGWKGRLGRAMVGMGKRYWLGVDEADEGWMGGEEIGMGRLRNGAARPASSREEAPGVVERERRRRSGTGPPPPPPQLQGAQGQHLRVQEVRDGK
ncbi:MAG: hypothetical protein OHK93_005481 [Ramalina farinacea]|uniref:Inositolphosphorylceramide synthase subunit Kei1-domain-containing protein n=1 Tax=Ramalina farinacea TaxID=258253 RepID=A0AA43TTJ4_9LECA|nr:hypothetical protein [Ramalina farinacea]